MNRLQTIDAGTLQSIAYEPVSFVVDDLLPQGLHLLAGAPKIGKSWLALWLCLCAAQGKPLWTFATRPCEVLYLCLEDSFQRIQSRLFDLTEDAPPTLHFAVMSQQLHNGLVEQIEQFLKEHPQTRLIVIDTLQRIRAAGNDANPYASDYRDIGVLKALADKYRIASRNVKYSDGTMVDGVGKGDTMDGIPGKDATYTGYHYTRACHRPADGGEGAVHRHHRPRSPRFETAAGADRGQRRQHLHPR